jgi:hypothetical protein
MTMPPAIRTFALTAHITSSVGWLGAAASFLALAVHGLSIQDAQLMRGFYFAMAGIGWYVIVPLSIASLATGLIQSLGTKWGLFRHYWVLTKFLLTIVSVLILFGFMQTLSRIGNLAADATMPIDELRQLSQSPVLHSGGGLLILLVNTTLSVYKPWGRTRFGLRKKHQQDQGSSSISISSISKRWGRLILFGIISLLLLFLVLHFSLGNRH